MGKNIGKNISKNLIDIQSQKCFDHAKQSTKDAFKTASKRAIQQTKEAAGDLTGNKIVKLQRFRNIHNKIIQKQLQMRMMTK